MYVHIYMCYIHICAYVCFIYVHVCVCVCVCVYIPIVLLIMSQHFSSALSQEDNNEAPEGWGLSHAVRGGTEGFHGLFKLLEVFLTLIFTFI